MTSIKKIHIQRFESESSKTMEDLLSVESALAIFLQDTDGSAPYKLSITMRTPGHDEEIVLGFLFNEGIIRSMKDVASIAHTHQDEVLVVLNYNYQASRSEDTRQFLSSSSCGVCGKSSIEEAMKVNYQPIHEDAIVVDADILYQLGDTLRMAQSEFDQTGALHAVGLFDLKGTLLYKTEDIGRHNALDKMVGKMLLLNKLPLRNYLLLLSGRIAYELVQKCLMAGCPILVAIGAPSSLSVEIAAKNNLTMVGFLKAKSFNLYSANHRISKG